MGRKGSTALVLWEPRQGAPCSMEVKGLQREGSPAQRQERGLTVTWAPFLRLASQLEG